ncbi:DUF881 domain-containing protein [Myceligenerans cantabricum]
MRRPLDPGYAAAAKRRAERAAAGKSTEPRIPGIVVAMLVAVGLGLVVAVSVTHLRAPAPAVAQARTVLTDQLTERSMQLEELTEQSVALAGQVEDLERAGTLPSSLREANDLDKLANGTTAVTGPGLAVTLTDGGLAGDDPAEGNEQRVYDRDLQFVVNALWASGAEAIAIDGQRLTAVSAIRDAGDAVLVDLQPLNGPSYRVEAIGDSEHLEVEFARTSGPAFLQVLASQGIESSVDPADELRLPAGRPQTLRWAATPKQEQEREQEQQPSGTPGTEQNDSTEQNDTAQNDTAEDGA